MATYNFVLRLPFRLGTILQRISKESKEKTGAHLSINDLIVLSLMREYDEEITNFTKREEEQNEKSS